MKICTKCQKPITGRQHVHNVDAENAKIYNVKEGQYHTKCCPLH